MKKKDKYTPVQIEDGKWYRVRVIRTRNAVIVRWCTKNSTD